MMINFQLASYIELLSARMKETGDLDGLLLTGEYLVWGNLPKLSHTIPCHAIQYHTISCHIIPYQSGTIPHTTSPYHGVIPYHAIPYHTMSHHTIPYHTIPSVESEGGYSHCITEFEDYLIARIVNICLFQQCCMIKVDWCIMSELCFLF